MTQSVRALPALLLLCASVSLAAPPATPRTLGNEERTPPTADLLVCHHRGADAECLQVFRHCQGRSGFARIHADGQPPRVCAASDCSLLIRRAEETRTALRRLTDKDRTENQPFSSCHGYGMTLDGNSWHACTTTQRKGSRILFDLYTDLSALCTSAPEPVAQEPTPGEGIRK